MGEPITETVSGQSVVLTQGFQQNLTSRTLSGTVRYDNSLLTPLDNTDVLLKKDSIGKAQKPTHAGGSGATPKQLLGKRLPCLPLQPPALVLHNLR